MAETAEETAEETEEGTEEGTMAVGMAEVIGKLYCIVAISDSQ